MKKIGICAEGDNLTSIVGQGFGSAKYLCVADVDENKKSIAYSVFIANPGRGNHMAQLALNEGIETLLTGYIGQNPFSMLQGHGIDMYYTPSMSVEDAIHEYLDGKLALLKKAAPNMRGGGGKGRKGYNNP
ncbi:hypothetical protein COV93_04825 [Candidatus Woesearchaeota archaeon CG11_big_fil_rev_8_21_14_0_20_43_8]|nr:MAG: hypothetical protein COV93_04825 [Candidatus Woesearchaeota archaeon CG11_big_fil_rev_8_21_14_0_20_43_8]PIO07571.1 MAG: hypothetical protein COT47_01390 [Candidatus Woesearchaeota archaeon CG08_land_8_20_14_0_20_43_7]